MTTPLMTPSDEARRARLISVIQACFVAVLWASSWVIIKLGLEEIPPVLFAGLRYAIASLILLALIGARSENRRQLKGRSKRWWVTLSVYGLIYISVTQGTQFVALDYLLAITLSLLLNLTPIIVLGVGALWLKEKATPMEIIFILISFVGLLIYFYPLDLGTLSIFGLVIGIISLLANSASSIIGRAINRIHDTPAIIVTGVSMSIGAFFLLLFGVLTEPLYPLSLMAWISILWLAVINTALAFTLWNNAMRVLRAIDSTLINSTMMPMIVILSVVFLSEYPDIISWFGLILLAVGITAVQILQVKRKNV